jgi:hypothetical protein
MAVASFANDTLFAQELTIEICREAVKGLREFRETVKEDLLVFNYDFCYGATFPNPEKETDPHKRYLYKVRRSVNDQYCFHLHNVENVEV